MANDAILLSADQLHFTWPTFRRFRAYLIGVAADNLGTVQITEYPGKHQIIHRPGLGRPHVWDFGFDGYMLYNKTGGLPDIVAYSLLVVRDRGQARKAGAVITKLLADHNDEITALKALAKGNAAASIVLGVLHPALKILGNVLSGMNDKVLDTMQGAKHFSPADKARSEIADSTSGAICRAQFEFDLFDAAEDDDSAVDMTAAAAELTANRTMLTL